MSTPPPNRHKPGPWVHQAKCRGINPDVFFPGKGDATLYAPAIAICQTCPVTHECLELALTNREQDGIWGGTTGRERRRIRRQRQRAARAARDERLKGTHNTATEQNVER